MGKRFKEKYERIILGIVALVFFGLAVLAIHEMQTAEGVDLYFALKLGRERLFFDVTVDILGAVGLFLLTDIPCRILKHRAMPARLRFQLLFLAFMPTLSMAYLLHPLQEDVDYSLDLLIFVLQSLLPFISLLAIAVWASASVFWKKWYGACCVGVILLFTLSFLLPTLQQLSDFMLVYLLLLICFDLWERLCQRWSALETWGWILFGGLGFRAFYVLSQVMRRY